MDGVGGVKEKHHQRQGTHCDDCPGIQPIGYPFPQGIYLLALHRLGYKVLSNILFTTISHREVIILDYLVVVGSEVVKI